MNARNLPSVEMHPCGPLTICPVHRPLCAGWALDESMREELLSLSLIVDAPHDVEEVSHLPRREARLHQRALPRRLLGGRRRPTSVHALN